LVRFTTNVAPHLPPQQLHTFTARDLRRRTPHQNSATRRVALTSMRRSHSKVLDFAEFVNMSPFIHNFHTSHSDGAGRSPSRRTGHGPARAEHLTRSGGTAVST